jgi:hypothetical protein
MVALTAVHRNDEIDWNLTGLSRIGDVPVTGPGTGLNRSGGDVTLLPKK